jgi:hypothetical protein
MFSSGFLAFSFCLGFGFTPLSCGLSSFLAFGNPPQDLRCRLIRSGCRHHAEQILLVRQENW